MNTKSLRTTEVASLRGVPAAERSVYCDREDVVRIDRQTRWGNPFSDGTKTENIKHYRAYLWREIKTGKVALEDLAELHGKKLACWCHPKACHGDVLVKAVEWAHMQVRAGWSMKAGKFIYVGIEFLKR